MDRQGHRRRMCRLRHAVLHLPEAVTWAASNSPASGCVEPDLLPSVSEDASSKTKQATMFAACWPWAYKSKNPVGVIRRFF